MSGGEPGGIAGGKEYGFVTGVFCHLHNILLEYLLFGHVSPQHLGLHQAQAVRLVAQYRHSLFDFLFRSHCINPF